MSGTKFTILKQCQNCAEMFEAQKRTTRFCSHKCASQNYKLRKRLEVKKEIESKEVKQPIFKAKTKAVNLELIKEKEFLTVKEVAALFNCSKDTVYKMINDSQIEAYNLSQRLTRVRRKSIEKLFINNHIKTQDEDILENKFYLGNEICKKYNVSINTVYTYKKKYNIKTKSKGRFTLYNKTQIDNLFASL